MVTFKIFSQPFAYLDAIHQMQSHVAKMIAQEIGPEVWLLEHPALYTMGTSANFSDIKDRRLPCYQTGRGGQVTYHGPGQRIAYVMLDLKSGTQDIHRYIWQLEEWVITTLQDLGLESVRRPGRVGIWICKLGEMEKKIAAIGIRIKKWVTFHGISLNINLDLRAYDGIVPCGLADYGVTSLADQGVMIDTETVDALLMKNFKKIFCTVYS